MVLIVIFCGSLSGPPSPPVIFGYDEDRVLRMRDKLRISCKSTGGNPLPDLKWFRGDDPLVAEVIKENGASESHLDITLDMTDNGAVYRCEASNSATPTPLSNSTTLTVMCESLFCFSQGTRQRLEFISSPDPPSGVKVEVNPLTPKSNEFATLTCITAPSSPRSNVSWWRDGFEVTGWYGSDTKGPYDGIISS